MPRNRMFNHIPQHSSKKFQKDICRIPPTSNCLPRTSVLQSLSPCFGPAIPQTPTSCINSQPQTNFNPLPAPSQVDSASADLLSLVQFPDSYGVSSYAHLCFPRTREHFDYQMTMPPMTHMTPTGMQNNTFPVYHMSPPATMNSHLNHNRTLTANSCPPAISLSTHSKHNINTHRKRTPYTYIKPKSNRRKSKKKLNKRQSGQIRLNVKKIKKSGGKSSIRQHGLSKSFKSNSKSKRQSGN